MANDNEVEGMPAGATVRPLRQTQASDQIEGLPEGATVRPLTSQTVETTKPEEVEGLPKGATLRPVSDGSKQSISTEKPLLGRTLDAVSTVTKPLISLYHGLAGDEETSEERGATTTASPAAENLGFKPTHIAHSVGDTVRGVVGSVYDLGNDLINTKTPLLIPDESDKAMHTKNAQGTPITPVPAGWADPEAHTLVAKYITAPSQAERDASRDEMQKYFETHGAEATGHALAAIVHGTLGEYVPVVGPYASQLMDKAAKGDIGGALSQIATLYAGAKVAPKVLDKGTELVKRGAETAPVLKSLTEAATTDKYKLDRKVAEAQRAFTKASKDMDVYKNSKAQGVAAPADVETAYEKARNDLAVAKFHQEVAPTLTQRIGTAAGRAVAKVIPTSAPAPEVPTDEIQALKPLGAPKPAPSPIRPINVKGPGEVAPEAISQPARPTTKLPSQFGRIQLPEAQGTLIRTQPLLGEGSDLAETLESTEKAVEPEVKAAKAGLKPISTEAEPGLVSNAYTEPKAAVVEKAVESPGFKKLVDQIGEQVRQATGGAKLQPDVSLREQLIPDKPVTEETTVEPEKKLSSRPDKAMLQKSGATDAEMEKILPLTRVELSKLANHFDVDLGESAIGRGKGDIKAGTHIPREAVLQKIVDAGYSTADIAKAVDNGEHLPKASGGSQMLDAMKQAEEAGPSWTTDKAGDVVEKLNKNPKVTINVRGSVGEKGASANDLDLHFQKGSSADVKAELEGMGFKLSHKTSHGSVFTNGKTGQAIDTWESVEPKRNR